MNNEIKSVMLASGMDISNMENKDMVNVKTDNVTTIETLDDLPPSLKNGMLSLSGEDQIMMLNRLDMLEEKLDAIFAKIERVARKIGDN